MGYSVDLCKRVVAGVLEQGLSIGGVGGSSWQRAGGALAAAD